MRRARLVLSEFDALFHLNVSAQGISRSRSTGMYSGAPASTEAREEGTQLKKRKKKLFAQRELHTPVIKRQILTTEMSDPAEAPCWGERPVEGSHIPRVVDGENDSQFGYDEYQV